MIYLVPLEVIEAWLADTHPGVTPPPPAVGLLPWGQSRIQRIGPEGVYLHTARGFTGNTTGWTVVAPDFEQLPARYQSKLLVADVIRTVRGKPELIRVAVEDVQGTDVVRRTMIAPHEWM